MKQTFRDFVKIFSHIAGQSYNNTVCNYVTQFLQDNNIQFETDENGNIFDITNKGIPLFVAHMDTVRSEAGICPPLIIEEGHRISAINKVLGGDDLNGVFLLLNLILERKINFLFTIDEETVRYASSKKFILQKNLFTLMRENIPYFVVLDRKGNSDICAEGAYNRYGNINFEKAIKTFGNLYGYKIEKGIMCDADYLQLTGVSGCNISVGYYCPHTINEFVIWNDVLKAYNFITGLTDNFSFNEPPREVIITSRKKLKKSSKKKVNLIVNPQNKQSVI
jgi:hypothetical protein